MQTTSAPLLQRQKIFASGDVDETRAFLRGKEFRFDVAARDAPALDVHINGVYLPGVFIGYIEYGAPVSVRATPARDDYWIQLPLRGTIETTTGRCRVACDTGRAAICAPRQENLLRADAGSARFNISLTRDTVQRQLTALLGDLPRQPLEFDPVVDLTRGYGRSLARHLNFAASELEDEDGVLWQPGAMGCFEELLVTGLLLAQPHSYSTALNRRERPLAPRDVKRAIECMYARLGSGVTLAQIVEQSGVPGRTLFKHFRDVHGVSPMRYLRNLRFEQVHGALGRAQPGETVGDVAARHGFMHMGRFSVEYRKRFGQTPSATLARHAGWEGA